MLTVTSVTKEKGPGYALTFSNGEHFLVSEDVLIRHRLLKNQEVTESDLEKIRQENQQDLGYQMSLNYLSYQLRTEKEVKDYLKEKEINYSDINHVITRLKDVKLVDDLVYAQSYLRTQMRLSDKGPRVLSQQLQKKGVPLSVIEAALPLYTEEIQLEVASRLAQKTLRKLAQKTFTIKRQKLQQTLMTKGFNSDVVKHVLEELALEKDTEVEKTLIETEGDKLWRKNARHDTAKKKQKVMQGLMSRGFDYETIQYYLSQKELEDE